MNDTRVDVHRSRVVLTAQENSDTYEVHGCFLRKEYLCFLIKLHYKLSENYTLNSYAIKVLNDYNFKILFNIPVRMFEIFIIT